MQAQTFLQLIQKQYQFDRTNQIFSKIELKNRWKHWLCAELINNLGQIGKIEIDAPYIADNSTSENDSFLSHKSGEEKAKIVEKRGASKCDFLINQNEQPVYIEIRCAQSEQLLQPREFKKFTADLARVKALKDANPSLSILTLFAIYGQFQNSDMKSLEPLDNSVFASYVLDTGLNGSGSIARFSHVRREGEDRMMLIAHSV